MVCLYHGWAWGETVENRLTGSLRLCDRARLETNFAQGLSGILSALKKAGRGCGPLLMLILMAPLIAGAQGSAVPARVTDRVDLTRLTTLSGNTHALAQSQYDQGAAPPDLPMNRIMLLLKRSPEQEAALQDLLEQQQVNSSPNYRKWLTPDEFGRQFGPADGDIQAVTSWLSSIGFQSIKVSNGRTVIEFSGTAAQVEAGLHTSIHKYFVNGEYHWANSGDPQIPTALAPVVSGFVSLHNFRPKPTIMRSGRKVMAAVTPGAKPQISLCTVNQSPCPAADVVHAMVPADFNKIYSIPVMTGSGVTIGIIATSNITVQDVADFRGLWGLPANNPNIILNGPDPGDVVGPDGEAVLDATWAGAIAPLATVDLVVSEDTNASPGTDLSEFYIIDMNLADVMTESFEACESQFTPLSQLSAAATFYSTMAEQAAAQGITYLVASGDGGPDACDDPSTEPASTTTPSVNILAATPFTTAVGGTQFNDLANPSNYWAASNNQTTGESALSYIPENVWNESCTVAQFNQNDCPASGLWSSGGGQSLIFTKPAWQAGVTGIPTANSRFVPDLAMTAAVHDGYVLCMDASCQGNNPQFGIAGGTSASVQVFGAVMALLVQKMGTRVGMANYTLYNLASHETYANCNGSTVPSPASLSSCIFNDVTVGNTNIPGEAGFAATPEYDQTTGLGSVNVTNLLNSWSSAVTRASKTTLTLNSGNSVNVTHGTSVPVSIAVTPLTGTGTPTGDVSLIANSATDMGVDCFTLNGSSSNCEPNNSTIFLPGGTYQVHAHYEGDGTFLGSDSSPAINVTIHPEASIIVLGLVETTATSCSTPSTVTYGSSYVITAAVADVNAGTSPCNPSESGSTPTGTVTLTDSYNGGSAQPLSGGPFKLNSFGYFEDQTIQLSGGIHNLDAKYSGDNSFNAPTFDATETITVTKATTSTTFTANPTNVVSGTPVTLSATIATGVSSTVVSVLAPTGTVQFLVNGVAFGSPVSVAGGVNSGTSLLQATVTTSPTLPFGQDMITAQYSGDANYAASTASAAQTITVTANVPTVTTSSLQSDIVNVVYPTTTLIASGGTAPYTWTITTGNLPTGLAPLSTGGVISGTPTAIGTFNFTVQVKDSTGVTATKALSITIDPTLQVTTTTVPTDVDAGIAYTATTLAAKGGVTPYTNWTLNSGALPLGLSLSSTGVISGTPVASSVGTANFTVKVTDSNNDTGISGNLTIAVSGFNFTTGSLSPITISSQGLSQTGFLTLNVLNGFTGTATLSANITSSPSGAIDLPVLTFTTPSSNFSSANNTMTFSNTATTGTVTLNVATTAHSALFRPPVVPLGRGWPLSAAAASLVCFILLLAVPRQRRLRFVPLVLLLVIASAAAVSCSSGSGGGGGGGGGGTGTTIGNYTITVSAAPSPGGPQGIQTATISLTVN
jgi:subtilase family serine protease